MRPFHEIEASRERRGWPAHYGREGAKILYSILFQSLVNLGASYMAVGYQQLLRAPKCELERVFHFAGLDKGHFDLEAGAGFVRRSV